MNSLRWSASIIALGLACFAATRASSQTDPTRSAASPKSDPLTDQEGAPAGQRPQMPDMAEMIRKWQRVTKPGDNHKLLNQFVGSWKTTTRMWMAGPAGPPTTTDGIADVKWVLDGRFVMEETKGEAMLPGPDGKMRKVPQSGIGLTGFDNYRNMFVSNWTDNLNTQLLNMSGAADPAGKVFTFYGQMDEPMLDVAGRWIKYVTRVVDDNTHVLEIYDLHAGDSYKVVEVTYERK